MGRPFSIHQAAFTALCEPEPERKVQLTRSCREQWLANQLGCEDAAMPMRIVIPGRPDKPELVSPKDLPKRNARNPQRYAAFVHALCHIEFNAINLALDAVYRFRDMPRSFYTDWLQVASEEAYHFSLLRDHLQTRGYHYGDFAAHNSLWEVAVDTDHDVLARMALVPRVQEAHGLDVTPKMLSKLQQTGEAEGAAILAIILRDEIGHVRIGNTWFNFLCQQRGVDPLVTFQQLLQQHYRGTLHGPFDLAMREQAGFSQAELDYFKQVG